MKERSPSIFLRARSLTQALTTSPAATNTGVGRMGRGHVCLLTEAEGSRHQGEDRLPVIKLTKPAAELARGWTAKLARGWPAASVKKRPATQETSEERVWGLSPL